MTIYTAPLKQYTVVVLHLIGISDIFSDSKESALDARDLGSSLGWEDSLEEGMATHSSIFSWRISMDRGAWQATVHGIAKVGHD